MPILWQLLPQKSLKLGLEDHMPVCGGGQDKISLSVLQQFLAVDSNLPFNGVVDIGWHLLFVAVMLIPFVQLKESKLVWFCLCLCMGGRTLARNSRHCSGWWSVISGRRGL